MIEFFKKLLNKKEKETITNINNYDLIMKLTDIVHNDNLEKIFYNPVNKIFLMNMYTINIDDLTYNLFSTSVVRNLSAVNVHSYFNSSKSDIKQTLSRITDHIYSTEKLNRIIEHDLYELCSSFEYLLTLENNNG